MVTAPELVPHLWFDGDAEASATLDASLTPGSAVIGIDRFGKAAFEIHNQPEGRSMTVDFHLGNDAMVVLNGGPRVQPTATVSCFVAVELAAARA
jgi:predicted 3-demethylubiquinone-9 3-methyltransferase (glyoxalase superfamily)